MISDHLERYYAAHADRRVYHPLRSVMIDGHEVTWMELWQSGDDVEPQVLGRLQRCECDFIEDVGWRVMEDGIVATIGGCEPCIYALTALRLRHLELRQEYARIYDRRNVAGLTEEQVLTAVLGLSSPEALRHIILDLVVKAKAGEWLEQGTGAVFWGGHYYVQTVQAITDAPWKTVWKVIEVLETEGKISLQGAVVCDYREPEIPGWEEYSHVEVDGWLGIIWIPAHNDMDAEWKLEVFRPNRSRACDPVHLPMLYAPTFGPDVSDIAAAEKRLLALIDEWRV